MKSLSLDTDCNLNNNNDISDFTERVIHFREFTCQRPFPKNCHRDNKKLFLGKPMTSWHVYYDMLRDVKVNHELFVKKSHKILPISFGDLWQDKLYNKPLYLFKNGIKDFLRKTEQIEELVWILDQFSTGGYYHWLTEILPRLWVANEIQKVPLQIPLYLPEYFLEKWPFAHELLAPFGREYKPFKPSTLLLVSQMHYISQSGGPLVFQPVPLKAVRALLLDYYADTNQKPNDRNKVYISRSKGYKRTLINDSSVIPLMEERGYKVVFCEELSIPEQINIFIKANIIVSIHGAGLTNMLFMNPGSKVLEIRNGLNDHMNNCFLALADTLGHDYYYYVGDQKAKPEELREIDYSMSVDLNSFEKCLNDNGF